MLHLYSKLAYFYSCCCFALFNAKSFSSHSASSVNISLSTLVQTRNRSVDRQSGKRHCACHVVWIFIIKCRLKQQRCHLSDIKKIKKYSWQTETNWSGILLITFIQLNQNHPHLLLSALSAKEKNIFLNNRLQTHKICCQHKTRRSPRSRVNHDDDTLFKLILPQNSQDVKNIFSTKHFLTQHCRDIVENIDEFV